MASALSSTTVLYVPETGAYDADSFRTWLIMSRFDSRDRPARNGSNRGSFLISFFVRPKKSATLISIRSLSGSSWDSRASARTAAVFPTPGGPYSIRFSGSALAFER